MPGKRRLAGIRRLSPEPPRKKARLEESLSDCFSDENETIKSGECDEEEMTLVDYHLNQQAFVPHRPAVTQKPISHISEIRCSPRNIDPFTVQRLAKEIMLAADVRPTHMLNLGEEWREFRPVCSGDFVRNTTTPVIRALGLGSGSRLACVIFNRMSFFLDNGMIFLRKRFLSLYSYDSVSHHSQCDCWSPSKFNHLSTYVELAFSEKNDRLPQLLSLSIFLMDRVTKSHHDYKRKTLGKELRNLLDGIIPFGQLSALRLSVLLIAVICLANKWVNDIVCDNMIYATVICTDLEKFNDIEWIVIQLLNYDFSVPPEEEERFRVIEKEVSFIVCRDQEEEEYDYTL